jgi:hypothetical protein
MVREKILKVALATAMLAVAGSATAAVVTLQSIVGSGSNFTFRYQATLGPDEGVRSGDRFTIFDFGGYVPGSVSSSGNIVGTTELTSGGLIDPGQSDDPMLANLVFTYVGPDFRSEGGPFAPFDFNSLTARSIFGTTRLDAFTTVTTKNNPAAAANTTLITLGITDVAGAVPEPATWGMLLMGFGFVGAFARRNRTTHAAA